MATPRNRRWFLGAAAAAIPAVAMRPGHHHRTDAQAAPAAAEGNVPVAIVNTGTFNLAYELGVSISGPENIPDNSNPASEAFSNVTTGVYSTGYRYEGVNSTSSHNHLTFAFLAGRGWKTIKIPTRWERLTANSSALTPDTLNTAAMASRYLGNPAVVGFHIMNEPNGSVGGTPKLTQANWYAAAQAAVTAIRAVDVGGRFIIRVGGWAWSSVSGWVSNNPSAWITDPVAPQNLWYEGHHYFDQNGSGIYTTYADAVAHAVGRGFTTTFRGTTYPDALYSMILSDLYDFKQWLITAGSRGVIGEAGVPNQTTVSAPDETAWCALLSTYLSYVAQLGGIGVNAWDCGEYQGGWSNQLSCYADSNRFVSGVDTAGQVSAPWETALAGGG